MNTTKNKQKTKFKVGDIVYYKMNMYESFLYHKGTITKLFKNGKIRLEFYTWAGHLCKYNVKASELELF